jgi:hypothetical protein
MSFQISPDHVCPPGIVSAPGLDDANARAWAALPKLLARYTKVGTFPGHWRGASKKEVAPVYAMGMLKAWEQASSDWKEALLAADAGVDAFAQWVRKIHARNLKEMGERSSYRERSREHEEFMQERLTNISGEILCGEREKCSTSLLNLIVEGGWLDHLSAWVNTGLMIPTTDILDRLCKKQKIKESWVDRERRLRVEWINALSEGRLVKGEVGVQPLVAY